MDTLNLHAAWLGILLGFLAGMGSGLYFQNDSWLGGYAAWPRRMMRLGHVSFFGIAFVNLAYALTVKVYAIEPRSSWPPWLFIIGAVTMPVICYLSAIRKPVRHLFPIPVLSLILGASLFIFGDLLP